MPNYIKFDADELKDQFVLLDHHIDTALRAIEAGKAEEATTSVTDIRGILRDLLSELPRHVESDIEDVADSMGEGPRV
jgi:hypothetical protein